MLPNIGLMQEKGSTDSPWDAEIIKTINKAEVVAQTLLSTSQLPPPSTFPAGPVHWQRRQTRVTREGLGW